MKIAGFHAMDIIKFTKSMLKAVQCVYSYNRPKRRTPLLTPTAHIHLTRRPEFSSKHLDASDEKNVDLSFQYL